MEPEPDPDPLNQGTLGATASPSSYLPVSALKHQVGFAADVTHFLNVQPGDIGARWDIGTSRGHTMLVVGVNLDRAKAPPVSSSDLNFVPYLAGSAGYEPTVLDGSSSGHGDANTRMITSDGKTGLSGGAGRGVMGGFANANGNVIGHTCGLSSSSDWKIVNGQPVINPTWLKSIKGRLTKETDTELVFGRLPVLAPVVP